MKKISILLSTIVLFATLTGCESTNNLDNNGTTNNTNENNSEVKNIITTNTCTIKNNTGLEQTFIYTATNDKIKKIEVIRVYDNAMFGVDTYSNISEAQKEDIRMNMLNNIGLEQTSYEGLNINIDIEHQITVTINADLEKADKELLEIVGLNSLDFNSSLMDKVEEMRSNGATCR